jgi:hypothetical protein
MSRPAIRPRFDRKRRDPVQRSPLMNVGPIFAYRHPSIGSYFFLIFDGPIAFENWPADWTVGDGTVNVTDIEHMGQNAVCVLCDDGVGDQTVHCPESADARVLNGQPYRANDVLIETGSI